MTRVLATVCCPPWPPEARELAGPRVSIGRDPGCDIVLGSDRISRRHAWVRVLPDGYEVTDRSANGTAVDGYTLRGERRLHAGPQIELAVDGYRITLSRVVPCSRAACEAAPGSDRGVAGELRRRIQRELLDALDLVRIDPRQLEPDAMRPRVMAALQDLCTRLLPGDWDAVARAALVDELADEALGLGPLQALLADDTVSEVMVVDARTIYVERAGVLEPTDRRFTDDDAVRAVIERIVTPLGRRIDESTPVVDARLPDGSRVHAIIPPLATRGPCITIRKRARAPLRIADLVGMGALSQDMADFLTASVRGRRNIVIAGGTGSGKTTLLNALSAAIPPRERIVTIEDAAELRLAQEHVVPLEARPENLEGRGAYSIRDLVKSALRMRPDRIVVGECRGGEAIDMLQAMNTGHEGSMTTTHANSPREAVARLETLCMMAGLDLPVHAVRQQIASSVHLIVQQCRFAEGPRRVTHISEVTGCDADGRLELTDLFRWHAPAAGFRRTGNLASFAGRLSRERGEGEERQ